MSTNNRLGAFGLIATLFSVSAFYLWPDQKWIGLTCLALAVLVGMVWLFLELFPGWSRLGRRRLAEKLAHEHTWAKDRFLVPRLGSGANLDRIQQRSRRWVQSILGLVRGRVPLDLISDFEQITPYEQRRYDWARDEEHRVFLNRIDIRLEALKKIVAFLERKK